MIEFQNLINPLLIILAVIFAGFSFYSYRINNPPLPPKIKIFMIALRAASLILLLFALFNTILTFSKNEPEKTFNYVFVDESKSITHKDSLKRTEEIKNIISVLSSEKRNKFFSFGSKVDSIGGNELSFRQSFTNYDDIVRFLSSRKDAASAVIISDGIITDGSNPVYPMAKLSIPVFTVGIGDTAMVKDISIEEPLYSSKIYRNRTSLIEAKIINRNLAGKEVLVNLTEGNKTIDKKQTILSESGINNISFNYMPKEPGEKKLGISISPLSEETNKNNNSRAFIVTVLNDKIKVFLLSGAPSPDVSALSEILVSDERIKLHSLTLVNDKKQVAGGNSLFPVDSADVIVLLNYPSEIRGLTLFNGIKDKLLEKKTPLLLITGSGIDFPKLQELKERLPFTIGSVSTEEQQTEVFSDFTGFSPIPSSEAGLWESLPPISQLKTEFIPRKESEVWLKAKIKNVYSGIPVVMAIQKENAKSVFINGSGVWRWKLQAGNKNSRLFDNFLLNSIQWLNTPGVKKFLTLKTAKKVFSLGERVGLSATIYDELTNPVENAEINVKSLSPAGTASQVLAYSGSGLYKGEIENITPGEIKIKGVVTLGGKSYSDSLSLFVEKTELEFINTQMDINLLKQIAGNSGGTYYSMEKTRDLASKLSILVQESPLNLKKSYEIRFTSNEIILIILLMLFSLEWIIRKFYRLM